MAADKDARDDTIETIRTTEIAMSDAVRAESGPASLPHFFKDAAYGVLPSPVRGLWRRKVASVNRNLQA